MAATNSRSAKVGNEVFIQGSYIDVGVASDGSLGSSASAPSGFYTATSSGFPNVAFYGNLAGFASEGPNPLNDVMLPGAPIEGFSIGYNGNVVAANTQRSGLSQIATISAANLSAGSMLGAEWTGSFGALAIDQTIRFDALSTVAKFTVTLKNTSAQTIDNVAYLRSVDPDQGAPATFMTNNYILEQNALGHAVGSSVGGGNEKTFFLFSHDPRAVASVYGFRNTNPNESSLYGQAAGYRSISDSAINIAFQLGALAPGASTTFSFYEGLAANEGAVLLTQFDPGVTQTWSAAASGDWSNAAKWSHGRVPTAQDDIVTIGDLSENIYVMGDATARSLTLNAPLETVVVTGSLSVAGAIEIVHGAIDVTGGVLNAAEGLTLDATPDVGCGAVLYNAPLDGQAKTGVVNANIVNNNIIEASAGLLVINGDVSGDGLIIVDGGALELNGAASQEIDLYSGSTLRLDKAPAVKSKISVGLPLTAGAGVSALDLQGATGFGGRIVFGTRLPDEALDLKNISVSSSSFDGATLTLRETNGETLALAIGAFDGQAIGVAPSDYFVKTRSDGAGGTILSLAHRITQQWKSDASWGYWSDATKWQSGSVPGAEDTVLIGGAANTTIYSYQPVTVYSVTVSDPAAWLDIHADLTLQGALRIDGFVTFDWNSYPGNTLTAQKGVVIDPSGIFFASGKIIGDVVNNSSRVQSYSPGDVAHGLVLNGARIIGSLTGSGAADIGGDVEITGAASVPLNFRYSGTTRLQLDDPAHFAGELTNMHAGLDVYNMPPNAWQYSVSADILYLPTVAATGARFDGNVLTVSGADGATYRFDVTSSSTRPLDDATLVTHADSAGGTDFFWRWGLDRHWTDGRSGDAVDGTNWEGGVAARQGDHVFIEGAAAETISVAEGESVAIDRLTITNPNASFDIAGSLSVGAGPNGQGPTLDFAGASVRIAGGQLNIYSGAGLLPMQGGATIDHAKLTLENSALSMAIPAGPSYYGEPETLSLGENVTLSATGISWIGASNFANAGAMGVAGSLAVNLWSAASHSVVSAGSTPLFSNTGTLDIAASSFVSFMAPPLISSPDGQLNTSFSNAGAITLAAGATLNASGMVLDNRGAISLGAGADATFNATGWRWGAPSQMQAGTITVGTGATLTLLGDFTTDSLSGISYDGGRLVLEGAPTDNGMIFDSAIFGGPGYGASNLLTAHGGTLVLDPSWSWVDGNGSHSQVVCGAALAIDAGATLEIGASTPWGDPGVDPGLLPGDQPNAGQLIHPSITGSIAFNGAGGTLRFDRATAFSGFLTGLDHGDVIDFATGTVSNAAISNGILSVGYTDGHNEYFRVFTDFASANIVIGDDGAGGSKLTFISRPPVVSVGAFLADRATLDQNPLGFVVADTVDNVRANLDALASDVKLVSIQLTDAGAPVLSLSVKQAQADSVAIGKIVSPYKLVVADASTVLAKLTTAQIAALGAEGVSRIVVTNKSSFTFNATQSAALIAANIALAAQPGYLVYETLPLGGYASFNDIGPVARKTVNADSTYDIRYYQKAGTFQGVAYAGSDIAYTKAGAVVQQTYFGADNAVVAYQSFTGNGGYSIVVGGSPLITKTVNGDGSYDMRYFQKSGTFQGVAYTGLDAAYTKASAITRQTYFGPDNSVLGYQSYTGDGGYSIVVGGLLKQTKSVNADGSYEVANTNLTGVGYSSSKNVYASSGALAAMARDNDNGSGTLTLSAPGMTATFAAPSAKADSVTIGNDTFMITHHDSEKITATAASTKDTFIFKPGFGQDQLYGFIASGAGNDTLQFSTSAFSYINAGMSQADQLAAVLQHATQSGTTTTIYDTLGDSLALANVTKATLSANPSSVQFV